MRVNIYAEELTDRVELVRKRTADGEFTGVRIYLELPVSIIGSGGHKIEMKGPFIHHPGDDDSSAVTFWSRKRLREALLKAIYLIDKGDEISQSVGAAIDEYNAKKETRI